MIMASVILRMLGMDKFTKFSLPPTPLEISKTYNIPKNNWNPVDFKQSLEEDPKAKFIYQAVESKMKQENSNIWPPQQITEFVNSQLFSELLKITENSEKTSRKATEADFGIKPTVNDNLKIDQKSKKKRLR